MTVKINTGLVDPGFEPKLHKKITRELCPREVKASAAIGKYDILSVRLGN